MSLFDRIEEAIACYPPRKRRRVAIHLFVWSAAAMFVNVGLYLADVIDQAMLILITLILSWAALTLTAADLVATTDVREAEDK